MGLKFSGFFEKMKNYLPSLKLEEVGALHEAFRVSVSIAHICSLLVSCLNCVRLEISNGNRFLNSD